MDVLSVEFNIQSFFSYELLLDRHPTWLIDCGIYNVLRALAKEVLLSD